MKSVILFSLLAISLFSTAQEKKGNYMPIMTKGIGVSFQKFEALNSRIANYPQYASLKDHMWTLSVGSMHVKKNFISQFTITGGSSMSGDREKRSSALRFLSGGLDVGYDLIPSDKVMLYPLVGIGAEGYQALFYKDVSGVDFNDVLNSSTVQNSIRSVRFSNAFITYRLGMGFALKSPKSSNTIGIQAGYTGNFKDRAWKSSENQTLAGAPVDNLSRFNISLVFTGGMMMK